MCRVLLRWLRAIRFVSTGWLYRRFARECLVYFSLRIRAGVPGLEPAYPELLASSQPRPSIPARDTAKSAAPEPGWSGTAHYLVVTGITQPVYRPTNDLVESWDHGGPEHEIGEGHHRFTTIDSLKTFIGKTRSKLCVLAERFQIGVLVQQVFADPIRDCVLQFRSTLVRCASLVSLVRQEQ